MMDSITKTIIPTAASADPYQNVEEYHPYLSEPTTYPVLGFELPNYRYHNFHLVDYNHTWSTDLTQFAGFQNSFRFEDAFVPIGNEVQLATLKYWHYSFYISAIYLAVIFGLRRVMRDRKPFDLRGLLIAWNAILAVFSILGVYRCVPEFISIIYHEGLAASYTKSSYYLVSNCRVIVV